MWCGQIGPTKIYSLIFQSLNYFIIYVQKKSGSQSPQLLLCPKKPMTEVDLQLTDKLLQTNWINSFNKKYSSLFNIVFFVCFLQNYYREKTRSCEIVRIEAPPATRIEGKQILYLVIIIVIIIAMFFLLGNSFFSSVFALCRRKFFLFMYFSVIALHS